MAQPSGGDGRLACTARLTDKTRAAHKELVMPRHITHVSLVARRREDLAEGWRKRGFALEAGGAGIALADGVTLDFRDAGVVSVGLSVGPGVTSGAKPEPLDGAGACFHLAAPAAAGAPEHANGAVALRAAGAVAESPADHAEFLSTLTGQREMLATSAGLEIRLNDASLDVLSAPAFAYRFGFSPRPGGFHIGGLVFAVKNLAETAAILRTHGLEPRLQAGRLLAGAVEGVGIAFEQA